MVNIETLSYRMLHCDNDNCEALIREDILPCKCIKGHRQQCVLCYGELIT